jgi:hypothetical protein
MRCLAVRGAGFKNETSAAFLVASSQGMTQGKRSAFWAKVDEVSTAVRRKIVGFIDWQKKYINYNQYSKKKSKVVDMLL